jgi:hypothetical protein
VPPAPNGESCLGAPHDHTGCPWTLQPLDISRDSSVFCLITAVRLTSAT